MLATCALMGAVSLLPLGCPSAHLQDMYSCAVRMVEAPLAIADESRCEERRLGCLMLSCLACNLPLAMLEVRWKFDSPMHATRCSRGDALCFGSSCVQP